MSLLQKESIQNHNHLLLISQRTRPQNLQTKKAKRHHFSMNQNKELLSFLGTPRNKQKNQGSLLRQLKKQFNFLNQNSQIMNRALNNSNCLNNTKSRANNFTLQKIKKSQIKLEKDKKQEWFALHKRVITNLDKQNDYEQRKIYKSRAKCGQDTKQVFSIKQIVFKCFKGTFPISRLNAMMTYFYDKSQSRYRIFLVGGQSSQMNTKFHFHQYHSTTESWKPIESNSPYPPQFNLSQHILLNYQKNIFIIGGIAVFPSSIQKKNERYNIPFISCFNLKTNTWNRINWNIYLRAHAAASIGNYGIIDGGIMQDNKNSNKIYVFDMGKTLQPFLVNSNSLKLSHHKIVSTEAFQDKGKSHIKFEGLVCFGGKKQNGDLNQNTYYMNYDSKLSDFTERFGKFQWNILQTKGKYPQPRYMHSMDLLQTKTNIFQRKVYCAILGGIGKNENILNDYWLLDLINLQWNQIILSQRSFLDKGIAGHCSITMKNQILIFGGYDSSRQLISKYWTITCENGIKIDKKIYKLRKQQQQ